MERPKQVIINDLMGELDKFGGHITQIRDAIQSKGVNSEGKLFKFAEEISSISRVSPYDKFSSEIERARFLGYSDDDIKGLLWNLPRKPEPKPEEPPTIEDFTDENITNIDHGYLYNLQNKGIKILRLPNVVSAETMAFTNLEFKEVYLPKLTAVGSMSFGGLNVEILSIPSFIVKGDDNGLPRMSNTKEIIVNGDSVIPEEIFAEYYDIPNVVIYNPDKTKKWTKDTKQWEKV
jgi:hypothetical protein